MQAKVACTAMAYSITSFTMVVVNKAVVEAMDAPLLLVSVQMAAGAALTACFTPLRFGSAWKTWMFTIPVLVWAMLVLNMCGTQLSTLGSIVLLRNAAPLFVLSAETVVFGSQPTLPQIASLLVIFAGAALYTYDNDQVSRTGLLFLLGNLFLTGVDRVANKVLLDVVDANRNAMVFMNNLPGVVSSAVLSVYLWRTPWEWERVQSPFVTYHPHLSLLVGLSCLLGLGMNHLGLLLQQQVSPTSMSVVQCASRLCLVVWGIWMNGDAFDPVHMFAIVLSFAGCVTYAAFHPPSRSAYEETATLIKA